jgi:predicted lipid-binding transport protein (Tim44 family)
MFNDPEFGMGVGLFATGRAGTVDGLFRFLTLLLIALVVALNVWNIIRCARAGAARPAAETAKAEVREARAGYGDARMEFWRWARNGAAKLGV